MSRLQSPLTTATPVKMTVDLSSQNGQVGQHNRYDSFEAFKWTGTFDWNSLGHVNDQYHIQCRRLSYHPRSKDVA